MIIRANAAQIPLADNSVHCVVTSPPYWGLRKYQGHQDTTWPDGTCCAYGLEPTIEQYVEHSLVILREVRRVLRDDGTCWWNLGDSYSAGGRGSSEHHVEKMGLGTAMAQKMGPKTPTDGLKPLDLCLIPERVALAAQADGWYVRSLVIWAKPNPMPESVNGWRWERHRVNVAPQPKRSSAQTAVQYDRDQSGGVVNAARAQWADCPGCPKCSPNDGLVLRKGSWRPTDAYEHILMLAKTADYFGDAEAVKEARQGNTHSRGTKRRPPIEGQGIGHEDWCSYMNADDQLTSRNLRNVWTFPTQPYPEAHFATFPERLPEICIRASTSERGCCPKCGANWARIMRKSGGTIGQSWHNHEDDIGRGQRGGDNGNVAAELYSTYKVEHLGWRPSCSCNAGEPVPCTVLDPFGGSGTTARVATRLRRRAVSIDLAYHGLAKKRTTNLQPALLAV